MLKKGKPVLVTGGSGYIASWIVRYLLEEGYDVRASVRKKNGTSASTDHLNRIGEGTKGKLELYEADLLRPGSFEKAMSGCEVVFHTASPFFIEKPKNAQKELIDPALNGTKNVLDSATASGSIKRVILTSSIAAIMGDATDANIIPDNIFNEDHWNDSSSLTYNAYSYSKTLAEKEAWRISRLQSKWDLLVINPGLVLGPSLSQRKDSASVDLMISILKGKYAMGMPNLQFAIADVRDVATAHILAAKESGASGRHLIASETLWFSDVITTLKRKYGSTYKFPKSITPDPLMYLVAPFFGLSWRFLQGNLGYPVRVDNSYSIADLSLAYRPVQETIVDHAEQIINSGMLDQ
jgi:nucleoside-diphosphate-sugar epimerase